MEQKMIKEYCRVVFIQPFFITGLILSEKSGPVLKHDTLK